MEFQMPSIKSSVQLVVVEDHSLLRQSLIENLQRQEGFTVVGQAGDGGELLALLPTVRPDVILLDLHMPRMTGFELLPILRNEFSKIKIIVLSDLLSEKLCNHLREYGVHGYVPKGCDLHTVYLCIRCVFAGDHFFYNAVTNADYFGEARQYVTAAKHQLSEREVEVLAMFCKGKTYEEIAGRLFISMATVKYHFKNIYHKSGAGSLSALVKFAVIHGITNLD